MQLLYFCAYGLIINITYYILYVTCVNSEDVVVWGPGLKPDKIVMPTRYFFIKLQTSSHSILSENNTINNNDLNISLQGNRNNYLCRMRTNLLQRKDGVYIFRYKLYEVCDSLQIVITYRNIPIGESPYNFGKIYAEECNCAIDMNTWLKQWECGNVPNQILKDLTTFKDVNWNNLREQVITKFDSPGSISLCHFVIKNNFIYRKCFGKYTGFKMFIENMLLSLTRKVTLPDVEFFVNLGDWPLTSEFAKFPIFSWCGSNESYDIVMPTYDLSESTLENLGRVTLDMLSVQGNVDKIWKDRIPKGFWRGRDSNMERLKLIDIARKYPNLFNVSLTNFFFFRDKEEDYGPKSDHISFFRFSDYKYQISIDGTVAAYRFPYLLGGGSLVFKQDSKYYEHFYENLIANKHYIPIKQDLSDLTEKLQWAISNDNEAYKIAEAGQKLAMENLLPVNIFCYYGHLLNQFSTLITSPVTILDDMELVTSNDSKDCNCDVSNKDEL